MLKHIILKSALDDVTKGNQSPHNAPHTGVITSYFDHLVFVPLNQVKCQTKVKQTISFRGTLKVSVSEKDHW